MEIKEVVLNISQNRNFEFYQNYLKRNPKQLNDLFLLVKNEAEYPLKEYSSWIFVHLCKSQIKDVQPFYNNFIDILFKSDNQSVLRNVLNVIKHLEKSDYRESEFVDLMIGFIQNPKNKVALQVYSMQVLIYFILKYPELKPEILEVINIHSEGKSPAYHASKRHFLNSLKNI